MNTPTSTTNLAPTQAGPATTAAPAPVVGCSQCGAVATRLEAPRGRLCERHNRISNMRKISARRDLPTPSRETIESLIDECGMRCPHCHREMVWSVRFGPTASVVSLQHWPDGRFGVLCLSCNARHGCMGDERFSRCDADTKSCSRCKKILPLASFARGGGFAGRAYACRECSAFWRRIRTLKKNGAMS